VTVTDASNRTTTDETNLSVEPPTPPPPLITPVLALALGLGAAGAALGLTGLLVGRRRSDVGSKSP
jgi:hypothetical protein